MRLFILDMMNLAHKCYWVHKQLANSQGLHTGVMYGARNFMNEVFDNMEPTHFLAITDAEGPTFRHEMYDGYKANRTAKDYEFTMQIPYYYDMFNRMGIKTIALAGFEADDLIGSAVDFYKDQIDTFILSGDKDMNQLLGHERVKQCWTDVNPYGVPEVIIKLGIHPNQMVDYLALTGDSADNVPGVKGVGPKGAAKLLQEYKTLDGIYANIENIKAKALKKNLQENKENAILSKKLVAIRRDIGMPYTLDDLKVDRSCLSTPAVIELYKKLEFRTGIGI